MFETEIGRWQDQEEELEEQLEEEEMNRALHEETMYARLTGHAREFLGRVF